MIHTAWRKHAHTSSYCLKQPALHPRAHPFKKRTLGMARWRRPNSLMEPLGWTLVLTAPVPNHLRVSLAPNLAHNRPLSKAICALRALLALLVRGDLDAARHNGPPTPLTTRCTPQMVPMVKKAAEKAGHSRCRWTRWPTDPNNYLMRKK